MEKKNQILMSVLGVFALVIVTVGVSYAFFTYSRTGNTSNTIQSGEISFTYKEGADVTLSNVFPVADSIGATQTDDVYSFDVSTTIVGNASMAYDIILVQNNVGGTKEQTVADLDTNGKYQYNADGTLKTKKETKAISYFTDDQIKMNLLKVSSTGAFENAVVGTESTGELVSEVLKAKNTTSAGTAVWDTDANTSEKQVAVAKNIAITSGTTHTYNLRLWIDKDVDYSNTALTNDGTDEFNDDETSIGKFNGYEYSLKVKIQARATNTYTGTTTPAAGA